MVATVGEFAEEVVDGLVASLDGVVLRRPAAAVMAEVDALRDAEEEAAAKEARRVLREKRKDEWSAKYESWKDEIQDQWTALKQKLKG